MLCKHPTILVSSSCQCAASCGQQLSSISSLGEGSGGQGANLVSEGNGFLSLILMCLGGCQYQYEMQNKLQCYPVTVCNVYSHEDGQ